MWFSLKMQITLQICGFKLNLHISKSIHGFTVDSVDSGL